MKNLIRSFVVAVIGAFGLLSCAASEPATQEAVSPLVALMSPLVEWTFDDCEHDAAWTYSTVDSSDASPTDWATMATEVASESGCIARLEFVREGASVAIDPQGFKGDGFGLSLQAMFPKYTEGIDDVTCTWTFALASKEPGDGDSEKIWKYAVEFSLEDGVLTLQASGYRESPWGGVDLDRVTVKAPAESVKPGEWYELALVVDRTKGTMSLWVDGEEKGNASFTYKTFDHIDRFSVKGEAWRPETFSVVPGAPGEDGNRYRSTQLFVDNVRLYALDAAQLVQLAQ